MLSQQQSLKLSAYADLYDIVVPQDHKLRKINNLIDFSFVYEELVTKYSRDNGRRAIDPIRLFKYLLLKVLDDLSDVDVVAHSRYDMSYKYFLGMQPEDDVIDASTLTKFRKLRLKDVELLDMLIGKTVEIAIAKGIIKSGTIIVDATHSASRSNPYSPVQALKLRSKQLRRVLYDMKEELKETLPAKNEDDNLDHELAYTEALIAKVSEEEILVHVPKIEERLNLLKETLEDIQDHYTTSKKDRDARVGHKTRDDHFFGYKSHIAMSPERIITAATITSGEKGDSQQLPALIEKSRENGIEVDTVIGDTAYSSDSNLKQAKEEGITIISKVNPVISQGHRSESERWEYNKDAGMYVCPAGHMATELKKHGRKTQNPIYSYFFDIEKCKVCALREGCYKAGVKTKSYSITVKSDRQAEQLAFQETEEFKRLYRTERYKIEAKNAELKNVLGYERAESYGMDAMQMQGAITMFVANMKRIIRLLG